MALPISASTRSPISDRGSRKPSPGDRTNIEATNDNSPLFVEVTTDDEDNAINTSESISDDNEADDDENLFVESEPYDPRKDLSQYVIPKYSDKYKDKPLLTDYPVSENLQNDEEKAANRKKIVETLLKFGIGIKRIYETVGPTITLYEAPDWTISLTP